jgi:hypothetical protein
MAALITSSPSVPTPRTPLLAECAPQGIAPPQFFQSEPKPLQPERYAYFVPKPHFGQELIENPLTCEEAVDRLKGEVESFKLHYDYNAFHSAEEFFIFFDRERKINPRITEQEAFAKFLPNTQNEAFHFNGGTCVSHSVEFARIIRRNPLWITAHVIGEKKGASAFPTHAAPVIRCTNGYVLVEIFHDNPLYIIKPDAVTALADRVHTQLSIIQQPLAIRKKIETNEKGVEEFSLPLHPLFRPDHSVMKAYMLDEAMYPVTAPPHGEDSLGIQVDYKKQEVVFQIGTGRTSKRLIFKFTAFDPVRKTIDPTQLSNSQKKIIISDEDKNLLMDAVMSGRFFANFKSPQLRNQLFLMVQNNETMQNLRSQAGQHILEH